MGKSVDRSYAKQMVGNARCKYFSNSSDYVLSEHKYVDDAFDSFCTLYDGDPTHCLNPRPPCVGKDNCDFYTPVNGAGK